MSTKKIQGKFWIYDAFHEFTVFNFYSIILFYTLTPIKII